jgi:hypothetical protein
MMLGRKLRAYYIYELSIIIIIESFPNCLNHQKRFTYKNLFWLTLSIIAGKFQQTNAKLI